MPLTDDQKLDFVSFTRLYWLNRYREQPKSSFIKRQLDLVLSGAPLSSMSNSTIDFLASRRLG